MRTNPFSSHKPIHATNVVAFAVFLCVAILICELLRALGWNRTTNGAPATNAV